MNDILLNYHTDYFGAVGSRLLQVVINACLHITWPEHISNQDIFLGKTNRQGTIIVIIHNRKQKWIGHTAMQRSDQHHPPSLGLDPSGKMEKKKDQR